MFDRLIVVLISHVLCCFSVLVCCRSLVQFMAQRREIKQSWNLGPASAIERTVLEPKGRDQAHA